VDTDGVALADAKVETADFGTDVTETAIDIEATIRKKSIKQ
jgi:hypothetical protein